jgi:phosphoglycolate phosphatase-like HAD superfamily hydrolase
MLFEARDGLNIDLENLFMVGDRWRDRDTGRNVACKTILLEYQTIKEINSEPDYEIDSLTELLKITN